MAYDRWWALSRSSDEFGELISRSWVDAYVSVVHADPDDIVEVDPGNGFRYTFDLGGTLRGDTTGREPRVVGVWGYSTSDRDHSRMRGIPDHAPSRTIEATWSLAPPAAATTSTSSRWTRHSTVDCRSREPGSAAWSASPPRHPAPSTRKTAVRPRNCTPERLRGRCQVEDSLIVETFENAPGGGASGYVALRSATPFELGAATVDSCVDRRSELDRVFDRGRRRGPRSLTPSERAHIAGITGHIAESVVEILLKDFGWTPLWHFSGPGRHGVDLLLLSPVDQIVTVEVKGTLVAGRIPRLSRREVAQMSTAWIDSADNPGMANLDVTSADVYGAVIVVNFADDAWRAAFTSDFERFIPIVDLDQLTETTWLAEE